jgi:hypothetical protein
MATLAADKPRVFENTGGHPDYNELPVIASDIIYAGAAVGESSSDGTCRPLVAGDTFLGFAVETVDNSAGSAAATNVKIAQSGYVWLTVTNGDNINDLGITIYASDDDTFTSVASGNSAVGKLVRYDSSRTHKSLVYFEAAHKRSI